MNPNDNGAKSLIDILSLCEQALAAYDAPNGTHDPQAFPTKARVPAVRHNRPSQRRFALIRGGLSQPDGASNPS